MTHAANNDPSASKPSARVVSGGLVSVRLRLSRENMEYLQGMVEMYLDSEEPRFRRIAQTVASRIDKELSKAKPHANTTVSRDAGADGAPKPLNG